MQTYTYTDQENKLHTYQIECLTGDDVLATRPLWEEVFFTDSRAFTDYYFAQKACNNITFVCKYKNNIVSMVHLTPYEMVLNEKIIPTFYIVGVATKADHRHRGLMATLLQEAFTYATKVKTPFVFLMPENPAIYEPFGFSYIYSRPEYDITDLIVSNEVYINSFARNNIHVTFFDSPDSNFDLCKLSSFANENLQKQYDYYIHRTSGYYETLLAELKSQNGGIFIFTKDDMIIGFFLYAKEEKPFIQEMLFSQDFLSSPAFDIISTSLPVKKADKKPIIMAKSLDDDTDYVNLLSNLKGCINEIV